MKKMPEMRCNRYTGLGLAAVVLWGLSIALIRSTGEKLGPFTAGACVYLLGGMFLEGRFFKDKTRVKKIWHLPRLYLFGCGLCFVLYTIVIYLAIGLASNREQALAVGMVNYLWPALSILFSLVLLSKKARADLFLWTGLSLAGIFLVLTQSAGVSWHSLLTNLGNNPAAYFLAFFAAILWALYSNLACRWGSGNGASAVSFFMIVSGLALLLLRMVHPEKSLWDIRVGLELIGFSLSNAMAYMFWDMAMRRGDVALVLSFSYFTPLFSTLAVVICLGVVPGVSFWAGVCCLVAGSFLSRRSIQ